MYIKFKLEPKINLNFIEEIREIRALSLDTLATEKQITKLRSLDEVLFGEERRLNELINPS